MKSLNIKFTVSAIAITAAFCLAACSNIGVQGSSSGTDDATILFDFEAAPSGYMLKADNADYDIKTKSGSEKLLINFKTEKGLSKAGMIMDTPFDWSGYDGFNIAMDAENPTSDAVFLYLRLVDEDGTFQHRGFTVPANANGTYYGVLKGLGQPIEAGMNELPPVWDNDETMMIFRWGDLGPSFDWSKIKEVSFFTRGTIADTSIYIDNIRIRENPPIPDDHLTGLVDEFGQNAKVDFPIKVKSEAELKAAADKELADLEQIPQMPDRSKFGGWKDGPKLNATGYFRTEKVDGKWWMVDPEGYLFFSHGVANVRMANLTTTTGIDFKNDSVRYVDPNEVTPEDSMGIIKVSEKVRESRFVTSPKRHNMFTWLPDYDDALADHYSYRRSTLRGPVKSGETFSFYRANLERRYGQNEPESYISKWVDVTLDRMKSWGFTSFGNWVDPAFYPNEEVPYFANGWIIGDYQTLKPDLDIWGPIPDFYDPKFAERADVTISVIAEEIKGSPWCIGVFIDNEKSWGNPNAPDETRYAVILDAFSKSTSESYAKAEFSKQLKEKYATVTALNAAWETQFNTWAEFDVGFKPERFPSALIDDMSKLYEGFSEQYFKIVEGTLNKYLPNHIYMGARMASWGMPKETIKAAVKYSDVMSFNIYDEGIKNNGWDFFADINKPVIIGEFHIGAISDTGLFHPGLVMAADQSDRAQMYKDYMKTVIDNPYLVGAHWFQYVDSPITGRAFDGENYNVGFVSGTDIPYPEMVDAARNVMRDIYPYRYNK